MSQQEISHPLTSSKVKQSFIHPDLQPLPIRLLTKIDIFSFIPVPKDDPVSTRQSLIGTAAFFIIFLTYVIFDFYQFVANNPPNAQNYLTNLPNNMYPLPKFAITFMEGKVLQNCGAWNDYINFTLTQQSKDKGSEFKPVIQMFTNNFTKQNQAENNDSVDWIDGDTKQFYNILRTPSQPLYAKGLLYSMSNASYGKVKIQMCNYSVPEFNCQPRQKIQRFLAGGRVFLFIENIYDTTDFSRQDEENSPHFFIYNFFLEPNNYKRITFNFQVVQTVVSPDFFFRFSTQKQTRLQIQSYIEQSSNVVINDYDLKRQPLDLIGIQFQLSPEILNVKVTYRTLIDHISMWGAFWGVLFAIFAIIFLTYNKKKFYKKNPEWGNFKKNTSKDYNVEEGQVDFGERNSGKMK